MDEHSPQEGIEPSQKSTAGRRRVLTLMGAGGAALVAQGLAAKEAQAGHDSTNTLHLGVDNSSPGGEATSISADADAAALLVTNAGTAPGLEGVSGTGIGVLGRTTGPSDEGGIGGVVGLAEVGTGVWARAEIGQGVEASSGNGVAVLAFGGVGEANPAAVRGVGFGGPGVLGQTEKPDQAGVVGEAHSCLERGSEDPEDPCNQPSLGTGVLGVAQAGPGVRGESDSGAGVEAASAMGPALRVLGTAAFATARSGVVPEGEGLVFVPDTGVTSASHVQVTLTSDPGPRSLSWVERSPGSGFTVHLAASSRNRRPQTSFTYLVVEPA